MSRTEDFDNGFWSDPEIEPLSADATWLYVWSWTNPLIGMAGLYKVSASRMTESKVPADRIPAALKELEDAELLFYDGAWLWVKARIKHLRTKSVAMAKSVARDIAKAPAGHPYRRRILELYGGHAWWRSRDEVTTLATEVAALEGVPHPNLNEVPGNLSQNHPRSQSRGTSLVPPQRYKGQGTGDRGKGPSVGGSGGEIDWFAWAGQNLPDVPTNFAVSVAQQLHATGKTVTADAVLDRIRRTYPDVMGATA